MTTPTGKTSVATPSDREVVVTREMSAPRQLIWDAWTRPEQISRWLTGPEGWTMPICEVDLRPGGKCRFVYTNVDDASEMAMTGTYREIVPPERLVEVESWGENWPETVSSLELTESGGKTQIRITLTYPSKEARDAALATGMTDGMAMSLDRLEEQLRSSEAATLGGDAGP